MSIDKFFNRSLEDSVLGKIEPKKLGVIPSSEYPPCPDCQSPSGLRTSSRGQQEYVCKNTECNRSFSESTKDKPRSELHNPPCPDCGSLQVHKRGIFKRTGEIKYTCYVCLRNFRESNRYIKSKIFKYQDRDINFDLPSCPECGEQNLEKRGFDALKDGRRKQKYRCNHCDKSFCESSSNRPRCPECQTLNWVVKRGATEEGKPRFYCQKCSKTFTPNLRPLCPDCGSLWIRKQGICTTTKTQKYQCNNCSRVYNEITKNQPKKIEEINPPCLECGSQEVIRIGKNRYGSIRYRCKLCREFFFDYKDNPPCPDCQNVKVIKVGVKHNQQKYRCKQCQRMFTESTKDCPKSSPKIFGLNSDYWALREMGAKFPPSASWFTANFEKIEFEWLKSASKNYIKHLLINHSGGTCLGKLQSIVKFSRFLTLGYSELNCSDINRDIIVNFYAYLKNKYPDPKSIDTRRATIKNLDEFIKLSHRFEWLEISNPNLIFPEDLPRLSKSGKTFDQIVPDEVLEQLVDNLDRLPIVFARMAFLMVGAPIRVSEACGMRLDCIKQDKEGDWWLHFWDYKLNKEHNPIPIRKELAEIIKIQQQFIRDKFDKNYEYLFCAKKSCARKDGTYAYSNRPPSSSSFNYALRQFTRAKS
jgi:transposase-like protein/integrase